MGCSWLCPVKLGAEALKCAAEYNPETDPVQFADCLINAARSSGCLACVCDFICDSYPSACSACSASDDETLAMFAAQPTFSITNKLTSGAIIVNVVYSNSVCNLLSRPLLPQGVLNGPSNGCGPQVTVNATIDLSDVACTNQFSNYQPFHNVEVVSTSTSGNSCGVQKAN